MNNMLGVILSFINWSK